MKNVVCFTDSLGLGGAQRQLVGLSVLLKQKGYNVRVLLYHDIPFYKHILDDNNIEIIVLHGNVLSRIWKLFRWFRCHKVDALIAYQSIPSLIACFLRPIIDCKRLIVSERNTSRKLTLTTRILSWLWHFADYIVPNSYSQTEFIIKKCPRYSDKLLTITNFIDTDFFIPAPLSEKNIDGFQILTLGRITPQKNVLEYIKAINIVRERGYNIRAKWYGDTDNPNYEINCKSLIDKYNLSEVFSFYPAQNVVVPLYHQADVLCLPSMYEGFPNVVCEAMGCGMPVLCSDVCDNPRIVEDSENGFLFSPYNAEDMADTIIKFINLPHEVKNNMGVRSRELALEKFSSEAFIRKYIQLIEH